MEAAKLCRQGAAPWTTSMVVCPRVAHWSTDFAAFDAWVSGSRELDDLEGAVSLVTFHPNFERWRELAPGVGPGSTVLSHYEEPDGRRSQRTLPAVIVTTDPQVVGARRVGVRFLDDNVEQWVPLDWLGFRSLSCKPLPDNWMHRAPHPTVHLIRRRDLWRVREADGGYETVAEVQVRNSRRIQELGCPRLEEMARSSSQPLDH